MFEGLRERMANGLSIFAERLSRDPRFPTAHRVARQLHTLAGVTITPDTAVQVATVWACLRYLSQTVAVLPWRVKMDTDKGASIQRTHPIDYLLYRRPNREWSSFQFRETMTHWALRWGNGFAEVERDQLDRPFALWPIHPERCWPWRAQDDMEATNGRFVPAGALYYRVSNTNTADASSVGAVIIAAEDMFHIRGFGEGPVGVNVMDYAAQSIGWARAAQLFGASFFGNGMNVSGVLKNKKPLSEAGLRRQRAEMDALYKGVRNANRTAIIDNDAEWQAIGLDPQKSQLIEVHQHLVEEICRWFGVPPHKVMHLLRSTNNNIEHQAIEVVSDSIHPWVKRFEDEADYKLFGQNRSGYYTDIDMRGLMRGDAVSRSTYLRNMRELGAFSVNQALSFEGENTIGELGEMRTMNGTYRTLEQIAEGETADNAAGTGGNVEAPEEDATEADESDDEALGADTAQQMRLEMDRIEGALCPVS